MAVRPNFASVDADAAFLANRFVLKFSNDKSGVNDLLAFGFPPFGRSDAYRVFRKMLDGGRPPYDWATLLSEARAEADRLHHAKERSWQIRVDAKHAVSLERRYQRLSGMRGDSVKLGQRGIVAERIEKRIARKKDNVFLPREFSDLGDKDQVLRAMRTLVRRGKLVRLGYGVYGLAFTSQLSGKPVLFHPNGFAGAAREALTKLGVAWEPTEAEQAFNEGRSTQIPANAVVKVRGRFSRRLGDGNTELILER